MRKTLAIILSIVFTVVTILCGYIVIPSIRRTINPCIDGHTYESIVIDPTCKEEGYTRNICINCEYSYISDYKDIVEHKVNYTPVQEATCNDYGVESGICDYCGKEQRRYSNPLGHIAGEIENTGDYCNEYPIGTISCTRCNETISEIGHHFVSEVIQATCTSDGLIIYKCVECNAKEEIVIKCSGHISGEWVTLVDATCLSEGEKAKFCVVCNEYLEGNSIEKKDHIYESSVLNSGNKVENKCIHCSHIYYDNINGELFEVKLELNNNSGSTSIYVNSEAKINLPVPEYENHEFVGWYLDEEFINLYTEEKVNRDICLYAKWENRDSNVTHQEGLIVDNLNTDFTFQVKNVNNLSAEEVKKALSIFNENEESINFNIVEVSDDIYEVSSLEYEKGQMYTVVLTRELAFVDTDAKSRTYIIKDENHLNQNVKNDVVELNYNEIAGSYEKDGITYLILFNDLINANDKVVVYDYNINQIVTYFGVVAEGKYETYSMYEIEMIEFSDVFNEYNGHYAGKLDTSNIVFDDNFEDELVETFRRSALYRQFSEAQKTAYSDDDKYTYKWSNIKITPSKEKIEGGIIVNLLVSSDYIRTDKETGTSKVSFSICLNIENTIEFEIIKHFNSVTDFSFVLDADNTTRVKLYVTSKDSVNFEKELHLFKECFQKIQESGSHDELGESSSDYSKEIKIGNFSTIIYGFILSFDVNVEFNFNMVGETGIEVDIYTNVRAGIRVNGLNGSNLNINVIKDFDTSIHTSIYVMGKINVSANLKVDAQVSFLGIVNLGAHLEAEPYIDLGGYLGIHEIGTEQMNGTFAGYIECGVNVNVYVTAGIKLKIEVKIWFLEFKVINIDKSFRYDLYDEQFVLLSYGTTEIPLFFNYTDPVVTKEFDCYGELNLNDFVNREVTMQNIKELKKFTKEVDCFYYMEEEVVGVTLDRNGHLIIEQTHKSYIEFDVKVVYGSNLISKNLHIVVTLNHRPEHVEAREPSCYNEGNSEYVGCAVCGDVLEGEKIIYPETHEFTIEEKTSETLRTHQTCSTKLSYWKICSLCNQVSKTEYFEVGELLSHTFNNGSCSKCGELENINDWALNKVEGGYEIAKYYGSKTELVIPSTYKGEPIIKIGAEAFTELELKKIVIPDTIIEIGDYAFAGCVYLRNVDYGNGVKIIGEGAFCLCISYLYIDIPDNVEIIKSAAYSLNTYTKEVTLGKGVKFIGEGAFAGTSITSIYIPNSVEVIQSYAFEGDKLKTIYCESESKPDGFEENWDYSDPMPNVIWGYTK